MVANRDRSELYSYLAVAFTILIFITAISLGIERWDLFPPSITQQNQLTVEDLIPPVEGEPFRPESDNVVYDPEIESFDGEPVFDTPNLFATIYGASILEMKDGSRKVYTSLPIQTQLIPLTLVDPVENKPINKIRIVLYMDIELDRPATQFIYAVDAILVLRGPEVGLVWSMAADTVEVLNNFTKADKLRILDVTIYPHQIQIYVPGNYTLELIVENIRIETDEHEYHSGSLGKIHELPLTYTTSPQDTPSEPGPEPPVCPPEIPTPGIDVPGDTSCRWMILSTIDNPWRLRT